MPLASYAPLNLCVHNLDAKRPQLIFWPRLARDMIEALTTPLPRWLSMGPYPFLCESSRSLLDELQAATPGQSSDSSLTQDRNFSQSLDTVLSTVSAMRAAHHSFRGGPNPRTPLFVGLIQSVLLAQSRDLILREYLEFVLPRYPYLDSESSLYELLPRYSRATLTGFCSIETRKWPEEHSDDPDNLDNLDDTQTFHYGCDNHIFIDKDLQPDVACVFIMSEQRNIYHALSSALYHRRAVGIHEPIIGLTFGEHGSSLHLVLAWLEKDVIQLDQSLPVVHLVHAPFEADGTISNGVFDMRDPIATLYLVRVLHSLPQNIPCITSQAIHESNSSPMYTDTQLALSWRADQILPDIEAVPMHEAISAWLESLLTYNLSATGQASYLPDAPAKAGSQSRSKGSSVGKASSKAQSNLSPADDNTASHHLGATFDPTRPIAARNKRTSALTTFSISEFAAIGSSPGQVDAMTYWILNRAGMREMKALPEMYEILKEERGTYVEYCKTYDALVALSWPYAWKTINDLPPVDPDSEWLRQLLWDMYEARVRCPERLPIQELTDPALVQLMIDRFQDLLRVVKDTLGMKRNVPDVNIPEATYRTGFNRLIRLFFDGAGDAAAKRLSILESRISMPRNDLADAVISKHKGGMRAVRPIVRLWGDNSTSAIVQHQQHLRKDAWIVQDFMYQGLQTELMAANAQAARNLLNKTVDSVVDSNDPDEVLKRAFREPLTGTVDNLGIIQIKDFFAVENPLSTEDINDFAFFEISENKYDDFASLSEAIEKLQPFPHRLIRPNDSRDPFMTARHEYLVDFADPPQRPTGSQTCLFPAIILWTSKLLISFRVLFAVAPLPSIHHSRTAQPKERIECTSSPPFAQFMSHQMLPVTEQEKFLHLSQDLFLPILVAGYKTQEDQVFIQGPNKVRSYLIAALKFLAACDITEFLTFSLYTEGTMGVVQAGWKESVEIPTGGPSEGGIHLLDRNCQAFDISDVLGAFNFAVFLARLAHNHGPKLLEKFSESKRLESLRKLREEKDKMKWKYADQIQEPAFSTAREEAIAADKKCREREMETR